jgi:hypothetical protein
MAGFTMHPDYDQLPEPIRMLYSPKEYAWLGDEARRRIMETECYPEPEDGE